MPKRSRLYASVMFYARLLDHGGIASLYIPANTTHKERNQIPTGRGAQTNNNQACASDDGTRLWARARGKPHADGVAGHHGVEHGSIRYRSRVERIRLGVREHIIRWNDIKVRTRRSHDLRTRGMVGLDVERACDSAFARMTHDNPGVAIKMFLNTQHTSGSIQRRQVQPNGRHRTRGRAVWLR